MRPRILVVYYSRTGNTKRVARTIAAALDAEIEEIVDRTRRSGVLGYLRSAFQAALQRPAPIDPAVRDPAQYDLVIVGTPIWDMSVSSPVRSYLRRHRGSLRSAAFFCTCGGRGGERAFARMADVADARPVATLIVREAEVERSAPAVDRFAAEIRGKVVSRGAPMPVPPSPTVPAGPAATKPSH
jgi:flavodoxin